jgi:S1-C subfamily serine protease
MSGNSGFESSGDHRGMEPLDDAFAQSARDDQESACDASDLDASPAAPEESAASLAGAASGIEPSDQPLAPNESSWKSVPATGARSGTANSDAARGDESGAAESAAVPSPTADASGTVGGATRSGETGAGEEPVWDAPPSPGGQGSLGAGRGASPLEGVPNGSRAPRRRTLARRVAPPLIAAMMVLGGVGIGDVVWSGSAAPSVAAIGASNGSTTTTGASAAGSPSDVGTLAAGVDPGLAVVNTALGYQTAEAAGTGIVLTSRGEILTNNHVIEGATTISVTDEGNDRTYSATVVGYDATLDVAVLQLQNASGLTTASIGSSANVAVGEAVVGIGNAGGTGTLTTASGSVTALNQTITASDEGSSTVEHLTGLIESNADIQAGDSGGPLVNTSGQVIGMDTAGSGTQVSGVRGTATVQAYSIPINTAIATAKLIEGGTSSSTVHVGHTAFLGVEVETVSAASTGGSRFGGGPSTAASSSAGALGSAASSSGAYVAGVAAGTPAQAAGLAAGDVITSVGAMTVTSPSSLGAAIDQYAPGATVKVVWSNISGQSESATITLVAGPAE